MAKIELSQQVQGILPCANGGTGSSQCGAGGTAFSLLQELIANGVAELDFTSAFSLLYDTYLIELLGITVGTNGASLQLQFSSDGGATYDSSNVYNWSLNRQQIGVVTLTQNAQAATSAIVLFGDSSAVGLLNTAAPGMAALFLLYDPMNAAAFKLLEGDGVACYSGDSNYYSYRLGATYATNTPANAFRVKTSSGVFSGVIRVYGLVTRQRAPAANEDYWINWVKPVPLTFRFTPQFPFEMHEPDNLKFFATPDEDYWRNPVPIYTDWFKPQGFSYRIPIIVPPRYQQWQYEPAETLQHLDEDAWNRPQPQRPQANTILQQWTQDPSDLL